jgi:hypothetical protein
MDSGPAPTGASRNDNSLSSSNDAKCTIGQTGDKTGRAETCACQKNISGEEIAGEEGGVKTQSDEKTCRQKIREAEIRQGH